MLEFLIHDLDENKVTIRGNINDYPTEDKEQFLKMMREQIMHVKTERKVWVIKAFFT